jgi:hypothetical protein
LICALPQFPATQRHWTDWLGRAFRITCIGVLLFLLLPILVQSFAVFSDVFLVYPIPV